MFKNTDYTDKKFAEYRDQILALLPINTDAKAKEYWRIFRENYPVRKGDKNAQPLELDGVTA